MIWSIIVQLVLCVTAGFLSIALNTAVAILPLRFKTLRTFSTCFLVHLSVVEIINAVLNIPLYIMTRIVSLEFFRAKWPGWTTYTLSMAFARMVPYSLVLLAGDKYCATNYGLRYHIWKTKKTTIVTIAATWIFSFAFTFCTLGLQGLKITLSEATQTFDLDGLFRSTGKYDVIILMSVPIILIVIFKILIWRAVRNSRRTIERSLPSLETRQKLREIQTRTLKTVAYTILLYLLCTVPRVFLFVVKIHGSWAEFVALYSFFLFGVVNPILYAFRHRRFRRAVSLLVRDPFGSAEPRTTPRPIEIQLAPQTPLRATAVANRVEEERRGTNKSSFSINDEMKTEDSAFSTRL